MKVYRRSVAQSLRISRDWFYMLIDSIPNGTLEFKVLFELSPGKASYLEFLKPRREDSSPSRSQMLAIKNAPLFWSHFYQFFIWFIVFLILLVNINTFIVIIKLLSDYSAHKSFVSMPLDPQYMIQIMSFILFHVYVIENIKHKKCIIIFYCYVYYLIVWKRNIYVIYASF